MADIAEILLANVKQYAQSLKQRLGVNLSKAQELTAKAHSFVDWHELITVAKHHPFDVRLRAAALSKHRSPAIWTPTTLKQVRLAQERMIKSKELDEAGCGVYADRSARGFLNDRDQFEPVF